MSAREGSQALAQEARRVLRRLAENGAYLAVLDGAHFGLFVRRNRWARPVLTLDGTLFKCLVAEGFVAPLAAGQDRGARYAISAEGEAFLRRATVSHDPFGAQHRLWGSRQIEDRARGQSARHQVNLAETPLGWLAGRRDRSGKPYISTAQYEAGERLREDFTRAQLMQRMTIDWSLPLSGDAPMAPEQDSIADSALEARRRLSAALTAAGQDLASLLIDVCCHLVRLEEAERARNWPVRTAKVVLRIGLSRLAEHYGLDARDDRARRVRHWRAPAASQA
jgi:hypothetical protein